MNVDEINTKKNINTKMVMEVCQHFGQVATNLLPPLHQVSLHDEPSGLCLLPKDWSFGETCNFP